jgi:Secretion system C-terminal sorting domain/Right handed beta helix region
MKTKINILFILFLLSLTLSAEDLYVDVDVSGGLDDGTSWANAFATITDGITAAFDDDVINIAAGTYTEINTNISKDLTLQGSGVSTTFIEAHTNLTSSPNRVFSISAYVTINDITIQHGKAIVFEHGGGIFMEGTAEVILNNCEIYNNGAANGAGIYVGSSNSFSMTNCILDLNVSTNYGGGLHCATSSEISIINSTISNNETRNESGGAVYTESGSIVNIQNSTISNNIAATFGGIYFDGSTATITNSTICGNQGAGGIIAASSSSLFLTNSIIVYNYTNENSYFDIGNYLGTSTIQGNYNILGGYTLSGTGNVNYSYHTLGKGDLLFSGYTQIEENVIYSPMLADNGGPTKTVALDASSIANNSGVRTGQYNSNANYAFYNGSIWVKVEDGTTSVAVVTEITSDQRGYTLVGTPDKGSYELDGDDPLPVELTSFAASYTKNNVVLNWITQSETDNLGFNLYRSENENGFGNDDYIQINANLIDGIGTTSVPTNYSFVDKYPIVEGHTYWYWLQSVSTTNELELFGPVSIEIPISGQLASMTILESNYPNPFNPETTISFNIKENESGVLTIYNLRGEKILKEQFESGNHKYHWNAERLSSGVYFYKLSSPTTNITRKMLLMK